MSTLTDFSSLTTSILVGIAFITFGIWYLVHYGESKTNSIAIQSDKKLSSAILFFMVCWAVVAFALSWAGAFQASKNAFFPMIAIGIALPLVAGILLVSRSKRFEEILNNIPQHWLVGIQIYRSIGILFLVLYSAGRLPGVFALPAGIGDMAIGLSAPIVAYFYATSSKRSCLAVLFWNLAGIADLVVAITIGFLSSASQFQLLSQNNPNTMITAFPLVLIPTFAVPLSIVLHLASLKKLRSAIKQPGLENQNIVKCIWGRLESCRS